MSGAPLHAVGEDEPRPPKTPHPAPVRRVKLDCPEWLPRAAKVRFRRLAAQLEELHEGFLHEVDRDALALLCADYEVARIAGRELFKAESLIEVDADRQDRTKKTPLWQLFHQASSAYRLAARDFAMTPAARRKLELDALPAGSEEDDDDPGGLFGDH